MRTGEFLTAEWRRLAMLNYEVDPAVLRPFVPRGVELDTWNDRHFVSVVGFLFLKTRVLGLPIPFHRDFEEINLRFYVRRRAEDGWRRGVVFIKEIAPRWAIATVARVVYNENYVARRMSHRIELDNGTIAPNGSVEYSWRDFGSWHHVRAKTGGVAARSSKVRKKSSSPNITGVTLRSVTADASNTGSSIRVGASGELARPLSSVT
jgi:uncharacterized protein